MELLWVRHAEPERIAPGTGVPRRSGADGSGHRAGRSGSPTGSRSSRSTRSSAARCGARSTPPTPIARALRCRDRDRRRPHRVRRQLRPLHPDGGDARQQGRPLAARWSRDVGKSSAPTRPRCSGRASTRSIDERRRAHPGRRGRRGVPRRRHQRRARRRARPRPAALVRAGLHLDVANGRVAHRYPFGGVA